MNRNNIFRLLLIVNLLCSCLIHSAEALQRKRIMLNDEWIARSLKADEAVPKILPHDFTNPGEGWYGGAMPKQVQEFILEKGELPDPHFGDNAALWVPVFQKEWIYCKRFTTPVHSGNISLCFMGLDTEVDVILNGSTIAYCNNMFRRWVIPVDKHLHPAGKENLLILRFHSPQSVIDQFTARYGKQEFKPSKYIRKCEADFSSYMGSRPDFVKIGIFDEVFLDIIPAEYFGDVYVRSELTDDFSSAKVIVAPDIKGGKKAAIFYELISPSGKILTASSVQNCESFVIPVRNPELWWPMTYGGQPLYRLKLRLQDNNQPADEKEITFGIRDLKLVLKDEKTGEARFGFRINGRMIFMHGACWAPLERFTHVWNGKRAAKLLAMMKHANLNFVRVWGQGTIPDPAFFEQCDRDGIVVWMEFMTSAPLRWPIEDPGFRANIIAEIEDEIQRLRNHPCIAIWCGGNEHYLKYRSNDGGNTEPVGRELFQKIMPDMVAKHDPQRNFHPSSPWGGDAWPQGNYPLEGDFHDYSTFRFQPLSTVPLFTSEVCMVSPYSVQSMRRFMPEEEIWPAGFRFSIDTAGKPAWPAGWQKHTTGPAWEKIGRIQDYCDIRNAGDASRVFGTAHGEYLRERYERQRRGVPDGEPDGNRRSWGAAVWRLNDTWPMIYMSVIDYYLEPKIPFYFLKRVCEPVLISFEQTQEKICAWITNDSPSPVNDSLAVELWTLEGKMIKRIVRKADVPAGDSKRVVDLTGEFFEIRKRDEFIVARLGDQTVTQLLWPEKFLKLKGGEITVVVKNNEIILRSDVFIKDVELRCPEVTGAVFSDNYFNLVPGQCKTITRIDSTGAAEVEIKAVNSSMKRIKL